MNKKRIRIYLNYIIIILFTVSCNKIPAYKNASLPVEKRVNDLLSRMTTEEKAAQLDMLPANDILIDSEILSADKVRYFIDSMSIGSIHDLYPQTAALANELQKHAIENTRLGIPLLFIEEALHGYQGEGATCFPIPQGMASTWDSALVYSMGRVIATEARAHGIHFVLAPNLDLAREIRWGRVEETYGEDVYFTSRMAVNLIKGLQGNNLSNNDAVVAEPKHFALHGSPENGSNEGPVFMGEREVRSTGLYVFEKAVKEAKAKGVMAAYHEIDGVPSVANRWLLTSILRDEWGFDGMVVTDLGAIKKQISTHKTAGNEEEAITNAISAGLDMQFYDFPHEDFQRIIVEAVKNDKLALKDLDRAVGDVLRIKFLLGLFDHPYTDETLAGRVFHTAGNRALALQAARKSIVLLKNDKVLPLSLTKSPVKRITLTGNLATATYVGGYSPTGAQAVSVYEALKENYGDKIKIDYIKAEVSGLYADITRSARNSDAVIVVMGEAQEEVGESRDKSDLNPHSMDMDVLKAAARSGKPVITVMITGRPLILTEVIRLSSALLQCWFPGEATGTAVTDVLFGAFNPSGRLAVTFPESQGEMPMYYSHKPSAHRRYITGEAKPLFSFGYGLSYTNFEYKNLKITPENPSVSGNITVSVDVTNVGTRDGSDVVQLYVNDVVSSVTTPVKQLKGFSRVFVEAGDTQTVTMMLTPEHLSLINGDMKRVVEPGEFEVMIGASASDIKLRQVINVR
ncbi:MAG: glycoside hydrolase family 3 C-terminal domain-containing protein [Dysgonamonadaceae bacterium]|jgi:beta-glucosidase|nr:glycoside hydrolase family 3 C-terminal domain-containing protein [Dysgonamonadaceae bacterium]